MGSASFAEAVQRLSIEFPVFMIAVIFHEVAHGFAARYWGDKTAEQAGRLTFNPMPHVDMLGTIVFPVLGMLSGSSLLFGWARPVPINPNRFKKFRPGLFWVSLAGPGANFLLAFLSALVFCAIRLWVPQTFFLHEPLMAMTYVGISLNFALGIFNLIPLPPLDGSKIIESVLPYEAARKYEAFAQYSFWILLALMFSGAFSVLGYPIRFLSDATLYVAAKIFHLPEVMS